MSRFTKNTYSFQAFAAVITVSTWSAAQRPPELPPTPDEKPAVDAPAAPPDGSPADPKTSPPADVKAAPDGSSPEPAAPVETPTAQPPATQPPAPETAPIAEPAQPNPSPTRAQPREVPPPAIFEPPLPGPATDIEPPDGTKPDHRAPKYALTLGARVGWLIPSGNLWHDGFIVDRICCLYESRAWDDVASPGPMLELDAGARISRNYVVFGFWEFASLGKGDVVGDEFGGQSRGQTHHIGAGMRFSSNPDDLGIILEIALGWRRFQAEWEGGTKLTATDDFLSTRIGLGMEWRVSRSFTLTPMATIGGGVFEEIEWEFADGSKAGAFGDLSSTAQHTIGTLQVGGHFDLLQSRD